MSDAELKNLIISHINYAEYKLKRTCTSALMILIPVFILIYIIPASIFLTSKGVSAVIIAPFKVIISLSLIALMGFGIYRLYKLYAPSNYNNFNVEGMCISKYLYPSLCYIFNDPNLDLTLSDNTWCADALPMPGRVNITNKITAHIDGYTVAFADCISKKEHKDMNRESFYIENWAGEVYEFQSKKQLNGHICIFPTQINAVGNETNKEFRKMYSNEIKVETDNIWFNEHFDIYATNQVEAMYFLTPDIVEFLSYQYNHGYQYIVCVDNNRIYASVRNSRIFNNIWRYIETPEYIQQLSVDKLCYENQQLYSHVKYNFDHLNKL